MCAGIGRVVLIAALLGPHAVCGVFAQTIDALMAEDRLRVSAWIEPDDGAVVPGQQVRVIFELATDTWFGAGTRFVLPEVDNAIVLRREKFATNLNRREQGRDWTAQRFELTLYPQLAGAYTVPAVRLEAAVASGRGKRINGTVMSPELHFVADIPAALAADEHWIASPELQLEQHFDRDTSGLLPGDAVVRTVTMKGLDLTAMALLATEPLAQPGLGIYTRTPRLQDRVDRGTYYAERTDEITYVIESPGQYQIPARRIVWWNTQTRTRNELVLPSVTLDAGVAASIPAPASLDREDSRTLLRWAYALPALLLMVFLGYWRMRLQRRSGAVPREQPDFALHYRAALRRGDTPAAVSTLYAWYDADADAFDGQLADWLRVHRGSDQQGVFTRMLSAVYGRARGEQPSVRDMTPLRPDRRHTPVVSDPPRLPPDHDLR